MNQFNKNSFPWIFFLLSFSYSWIIWMPCILQSYKIIELPFPHIVLIGTGAFGPTFAAFLLTYKKEGNIGLKRLIHRGIAYKISLRWYIPIIVVIPVLCILSLVIDYSINSKIPEFDLLYKPWLILPYFLFLFFLGGSLQEEFGWRGYALDIFQSRWSAFVSSLILGCIWALWHLPLFFIEGINQQFIPFGLFFLTLVALSILFTWFHNNTGGSVFIALLFHTIFNLSFALFPQYEMKEGGNHNALLYFTILAILISIFVVLIFGKRTLAIQSETE